MSSRNRPRKVARREPFKDRLYNLLIVCEGEVTEKEYFEQLALFFRNPLVNVEVSPEHDKSLPAIRIAKRLWAKSISDAKRQSDVNLRYDKVWCVYDVDDHDHLPEAAEMARRNHIEIALSNPCFELWLVLHKRHSPGSRHRHKIQDLLKTFIPDYDKGVDFNHYKDGYESAVSRAKKLDELAESVGEPGRNPTTGVYKLTETIVPPKTVSPPPAAVVKRHAPKGSPGS